MNLLDVLRTVPQELICGVSYFAIIAVGFLSARLGYKRGYNKGIEHIQNRFMPKKSPLKKT